jgi:murein DD-endopeptidase MepM/ murein hydrolase activator NlpD
MKAKTLFQIFVSALLVFAEAFAAFPVSAKPAPAPLQAGGWNGSAYVGLRAPFAYGTEWEVASAGPDHSGTNRHTINFGMPNGTAVLAMYGGTVMAYKVGNTGGAGNELDIDHGDGYCSAYLHLTNATVGVGQSVKQGDQVALSGNTGDTTGPNLQVEVDQIVNGSCNTDTPSTPEVPIYFDEISGRELQKGDKLRSQNPPDTIRPTVVSSVLANPSPTKAASVDFTVTFSEEVTGVDAGDFMLIKTGAIVGESVSSVNPVGGSQTVYTVTVNTGAGDGDLRLVVPDAATVTVTDRAGNLLVPFGGGESYKIDKTAPTVVSSVLANPSPTKATSMDFTVTFSEDVTGVDAGDFMLIKTGAIAGESISSVNPVGSSQTIYTVTVNAGTGDGDLRLTVPDAATVSATDRAGNLLIPFGGGESYKIDKTPPTVTITPPVNPSTLTIATPPANPSTLDFTVTFSEDVKDVDKDDFTLTKTGKVTGESITGVSGGPSVYTVSVNPGTGEGNLCLNMSVGATVNDLAGNPLTEMPATPVCLAIDATPPTVISVVPAGCNGNFTVTFSEDVTGVDSNDFILTKNGSLTGVGIKEVTGGPVIYTVVVETGKGEGTLRLEVPVSATIVDTKGNSLIKAYPYGKIYTILSETFRSNGYGDGWILESSEGSGLGGSVNSSALTFNVGDDVQNRQYRAVLYFPTAYLPDNAVALQSVLKIKKVEEIGTPFASLGDLSVDIRNGLLVPGLGPLSTASFEAKADADAVGTMLSSAVPDYRDGIGWYAAPLDGKASSYINPLGGTQIRLSFKNATNKNALTDYVKFYSGDAEWQKDRPHLDVRYCVPR